MSLFNTDEEKAYLKTLLHEGEVTINFTKKDGTNRVMKCTLKEESIPGAFTPKGTGKAKSSDVVAVFDIENQGWRSFHWDSITSFNFSV